jgi:glycosyltransferase involved in cell wall biosynthesis
MKIFVTGTRGIPDIPGGVEKHCQDLYPLIAAKGHEVIVATRKPYVQEMKSEWNGVKLEHIHAPRLKSLEAIVHTFIAVLKARLFSPDILHIHAIGPGLMVPLARILGMKVVITNHGPDYDRQKWGLVAKTILRLGEWTGAKFANQVIVISSIIRDNIKKRCGQDSNLIFNGVSFPQKSKLTDFLDNIGVEPGKYILAVSRLVPEKGLHLLVDAFQRLSDDYKLVIAGDADHETVYSRNLKKIISADKRIIHTGYIIGEDLNQVFSHAKLFVLPSFHEGLPIALLEAMSYGLSVLVSDIPANKGVDLADYRFFKSGDMEDLSIKMEYLMQEEIFEDEKSNFRTQIAEKYDWNKIAEQTLDVYNKALILR